MWAPVCVCDGAAAGRGCPQRFGELFYHAPVLRSFEAPASADDEFGLGQRYFAGGGRGRQDLHFWRGRGDSQGGYLSGASFFFYGIAVGVESDHLYGAIQCDEGKSLTRKDILFDHKPIGRIGQRNGSGDQPCFQPDGYPGGDGLAVEVIGKNDNSSARRGGQVCDKFSIHLCIECVQAFLGWLMDFFYPIFTKGGQVSRHRSEQDGLCCSAQLGCQVRTVTQRFKGGLCYLAFRMIDEY